MTIELMVVTCVVVVCATLTINNLIAMKKPPATRCMNCNIELRGIMDERGG